MLAGGLITFSAAQSGADTATFGSANCVVTILSGASLLTGTGDITGITDSVACVNLPDTTANSTVYDFNVRVAYGGYTYLFNVAACATTFYAPGDSHINCNNDLLHDTAIGSLTTFYAGTSTTGTGNTCLYTSTGTTCLSTMEHGNSQYYQTFAPHGSTSGTNVNQTVYNGTAIGSASIYVNGSLANPCGFIDVAGNLSGPTGDGTTPYTYSMDFTAPSPGVDAIVMDDDGVVSGSTIVIFGKTFFTSSGFADKYEPLGTTYVNFGSPVTLTITVKSGDEVNPDMWCHYGGNSGHWVQWGNVSALAGSSAGNAGSGSQNGTSLGQCLDSTGWSLTDPGSWVLGGLDDLICIMKWMFEPTPANVTALGNEFGLSGSPACAGGGGSATVSQWFGCMTQGLLVAPAADIGTLKGYADSDSCTSITGGATNITIAGTSINACTIVADVNSSHFSPAASSLIGGFVNLMAAAVYILSALAFLHFLIGIIGATSGKS